MSRIIVIAAAETDINNNFITAVAISWIRRWPAVRLAVKRTPRAKGRINKLVVSIITSVGIRRGGVLSGSRWPRALVLSFRKPVRTVANQRGMARPKFIDS